MGKKIDMSNKIYGKIEVIEEAGRNKEGRVLWLCKCSCGNVKKVLGKNLRNGHSKTCKSCRTNIRYHSEGDKTIGELPSGEKFIIDTEDLDKIKDYRWLPNGLGYFVAQIDKKRVRMHRLIVNAPKGMVVDHISRNTFDNSKSNLRLCRHQENIFNHKLKINNSSGFTGASYHKKINRYVATISFNYKHIYLGCFIDKIEAAQAHNEAAVVLFREVC